jgi:hypothetical protein
LSLLYIHPPSRLPLSARTHAPPPPSNSTQAPPSRGLPSQHSSGKCGSPRLHLGPYRRQEVRGRSGFSADFHLKPHRHGTVYQTVKMQYQLDSETTKYAYTEAWTTTKRRGLDQGGRDSFLIPDSDVAQYSGSLTIHTVAWWEAGAIARGFARGQKRRRQHKETEGQCSDELWGSLRGQQVMRPVPRLANPIERRVSAQWEKGGQIQWSL